MVKKECEKYGPSPRHPDSNPPRPQYKSAWPNLKPQLPAPVPRSTLKQQNIGYRIHLCLWVKPLCEKVPLALAQVTNQWEYCHRIIDKQFGNNIIIALKLQFGREAFRRRYSVHCPLFRNGLWLQIIYIKLNYQYRIKTTLNLISGVEGLQMFGIFLPLVLLQLTYTYLFHFLHCCWNTASEFFFIVDLPLECFARTCQLGSMPSATHQYAGTWKDVCNKFFPSVDRDIHPTWFKCYGHVCNINNAVCRVRWGMRKSEVRCLKKRFSEPSLGPSSSLPANISCLSFFFLFFFYGLHWRFQSLSTSWNWEQKVFGRGSQEPAGDHHTWERFSLWPGVVVH